MSWKPIGIVMSILLLGMLHLILATNLEVGALRPSGQEKVTLRLHGMDYGPFRKGQSPEMGIFPSLEQVREDMPLIKVVGNAVRTYGCQNLETVITATGEVNLSLAQGVWLSSNSTANQQEITCAVEQANQNPHINSLVVGNESILFGSLTTTELCQIIEGVKGQVSVPVTTGETWNSWASHPELVDCVDYLLVHIHPYWECRSAETAALYVQEKYEHLRALYPNKRIVIGETGWPTGGGIQCGVAVPSLENQVIFANDFLNWVEVEGVDYYWFEVFDEPWKCKGVRPEVECHWGIYDEDRTFKPARDVFWSHRIYFPLVMRNYSPPEVEITWPQNGSSVTTTSNCVITVKGNVEGVVGEDWYLTFSVYTDKWYYQDPVVYVPYPSGDWQTRPIYLAGQGIYNNHRIKARLYDASGTMITSDKEENIVRTNSCRTP